MRPESRLGARPHFDDRDLPEVMTQIEQVLRSGKLILGEHTENLERDFAAYAGTKHAVAVSSCTAALEIALTAAGVHGRQVVMPTCTFVATAAAAQRAGAEVVFCESSERDFCMDVDDAISRMTEKTAAVVTVHLAGFIMHDLEQLRDECKRRGVWLIEDCAHAHGATLGERRAGSLGDVGCFSLYPTKIMTSGTGGMVTTDRDEVAALARSLRHHGQGRSLEDVVGVGGDYLMGEIQAILARAQLKRLDEVVAHRRTVASAYQAATYFFCSRSIPAPSVSPSYYKFPVNLGLGGDRDLVRQRMRERGIETGALYSPLVHEQPAFRRPGISFPRTERLLKQQLCLPMHALVDPNDCREIIETLRQCL